MNRSLKARIKKARKRLYEIEGANISDDDQTYTLYEELTTDPATAQILREIDPNTSREQRLHALVSNPVIAVRIRENWRQRVAASR